MHKLWRIPILRDFYCVTGKTKKGEDPGLIPRESCFLLIKGEKFAVITCTMSRHRTSSFYSELGTQEWRALARHGARQQLCEIATRFLHRVFLSTASSGKTKTQAEQQNRNNNDTNLLIASLCCHHQRMGWALSFWSQQPVSSALQLSMPG